MLVDGSRGQTWLWGNPLATPAALLTALPDAPWWLFTTDHWIIFVVFSRHFLTYSSTVCIVKLWQGHDVISGLLYVRSLCGVMTRHSEPGSDQNWVNLLLFVLSQRKVDFCMSAVLYLNEPDFLDSYSFGSRGLRDPTGNTTARPVKQPLLLLLFSDHCKISGWGLRIPVFGSFWTI